MKSAAGKLPTISLLAVYGGISLLGHGLHWLAPEDGHHHGMHVVARDSCGHDHRHDHDHGHGHDDHHYAGNHQASDHQHGPSQPGDCERDCNEQTVQSNECGTHSHLCEICEFLSQARGERTKLAAAVDWHPLVADAVGLPQRSYWLVSLSQHAPRGPPQIG